MVLLFDTRDPQLDDWFLLDSSCDSRCRPTGSVGSFYILLQKDEGLHFKHRISKDIFFWHKACLGPNRAIRLCHYGEGVSRKV